MDYLRAAGVRRVTSRTRSRHHSEEADDEESAMAALESMVAVLCGQNLELRIELDEF